MIQKANNHRSNTNKFIEKSIKIHGDIYDYTKVNYLKAQENVIIICKKHGKFEQRACDHLRGKGCKMCKIEQNSDNCRSNINEFIEKANLIHNNKYNYSKSTYLNGKTKLIIICQEHGEFEQQPCSHLNGNGCANCGVIQQANNRISNIDEFIKKSIKMHGDTYDYIKV
jgi:hypothetical protein